ncbi:MAG: response regulator, partial [Nitrospirales bacterium]
MKNKSARILLVDDDELNLEILVEYLKDEPYELIRESDGGQAVERLQKDPQGFQALVLDRMMPGINGLEVLAQLKADEQLQWLPVVM